MQEARASPRWRPWAPRGLPVRWVGAAESATVASVGAAWAEHALGGSAEVSPRRRPWAPRRRTV
eukprot:8458594-Pyramimonas_sp.AAC.1